MLQLEQEYEAKLRSVMCELQHALAACGKVQFDIACGLLGLRSFWTYGMQCPQEVCSSTASSPVYQNCVANTFALELILHKMEDLWHNACVAAVVANVAASMEGHQDLTLLVTFAQLNEDHVACPMAGALLQGRFWRRPPEWKYAEFNLTGLDGLLMQQGHHHIPDDERVLAACLTKCAAGTSWPLHISPA
jgi:hypothetical protein